MLKHFYLFLITLLPFFGIGQEINAVITINSDQVSQTNQQIFTTLERSLTDFVNKTKWTNRTYNEVEKLNVRMFITVTEFQNDRFKASIQLQSSRPVYNSSYESPVFNFKDNQYNFEYTEFQPLVFNENVFESNLVSVVAFYNYIMLGIDADTFELEGGTDFYRKAQNIVTQAQGGNSAGWSQDTKERTRFELVDNLMSNAFKEYRAVMYNYHRKGLDILADNNSTGKQVISGSMRLLETLVKRRPNAFLIQTFFDAKSEEIQNVFSDGPKVDVVQLKDILNRIAPLYSKTWNAITY
ncbi:MAG: DUF4835 family protein [Cellulophaga sp.]|nr:DUF4835 family protein [Cellulophaga sp.]